MVTFIKKRDGRVVDFNAQKIANAIMKAMNKCDLNGIKYAEEAAYIANSIEKELDKNIVDIETIQDMVEEKLMASDYKQVAKEYITYRNERSRARQFNSTIMKKINNVLNCNDIQNSNANVDENSFGGRKNESSNILQKEIALESFIRSEVAEAHRKNRLYIHDLSELPIGMHNCLFVNIQKLLRDGFLTRNGDVRPANCFATACQLIAVIFQIQSR